MALLSSRVVVSVVVVLLLEPFAAGGFFAVAVLPKRRAAAVSPPPPPPPRRPGFFVAFSHSSSPRSTPSSDKDDGGDLWPIPPLRFEIKLDGGGKEDDAAAVLKVELAGPGDIGRAVRDCRRAMIAAGSGGGSEEREDHEEKEVAERELQTLFTEFWDGHADSVRREQAEIRDSALYEGPKPDTLAEHRGSVVASIPVLRNGFVLEVADSTVPGAGKGIFLRPMTNTNNGGGSGDDDYGSSGGRRGKTIWQVRGSVFCGYAGGVFADRLDDAGGGGAMDRYRRDRTFEFRLGYGTESTVWFRGEIMTIADAVDSTGATGLAGHELVFGSTSGGQKRTLEGVRPLGEDEDDGLGGGGDGRAFRYFVPHDDGDGRYEGITIRTLGRMANDLAMVGEAPRDEAEYLERSRTANALVLVPQIELVEDDDGGTATTILRPSGGPILTVRETIRIDATRDEPMEIGCEYGYHYWENQQKQEEEKKQEAVAAATIVSNHAHCNDLS